MFLASFECCDVRFCLVSHPHYYSALVVCPFGRFGEECQSNCSSFCSNETGCAATTGHCIDCVPGRMGVFCENRKLNLCMISIYVLLHVRVFYIVEVCTNLLKYVDG